jgi:hypothetical protein
VKCCEIRNWNLPYAVRMAACARHDDRDALGEWEDSAVRPSVQWRLTFLLAVTYKPLARAETDPLAAPRQASIAIRSPGQEATACLASSPSPARTPNLHLPTQVEPWPGDHSTPILRQQVSRKIILQGCYSKAA